MEKDGIALFFALTNSSKPTVTELFGAFTYNVLYCRRSFEGA